MNTIDKPSELSKFRLDYESPPLSDELIADAIAHQWLIGYRKFVLFMNHAGLLSQLRFGRRR